MKQLSLPFNDFNQYQNFVESMIITEGNLRIMENAFGLMSEAGEVAGKFQKNFRGDTSLDLEAVAKELGDVLFYTTALAGALNIPLYTIAMLNMQKLQARKEQNKIKGDGDDREMLDTTEVDATTTPSSVSAG